jgi:hypothetical protein
MFLEQKAKKLRQFIRRKVIPTGKPHRPNLQRFLQAVHSGHARRVTYRQEFLHVRNRMIDSVFDIAIKDYKRPWTEVLETLIIVQRLLVTQDPAWRIEGSLIAG